MSEQQQEPYYVSHGVESALSEAARKGRDINIAGALYRKVNHGETTTILLHSFDRWTGMCRCGEGPFVIAEWVAHYDAQDEPVRTTAAGSWPHPIAVPGIEGEPCRTCGLMPEHPDDREPIEPGDYHTVDPSSPNRCPSCGLVPSRGSEGAQRVATARAEADRPAER